MTTAGSELARVTMVGRDLRVIYDVLCKPFNEVTDYLTSYSGITPQTLEGVTRTLKDVQSEIFALIDRETTLVGHSLENDFKALKLIHPKVVDSAVVYIGMEIQQQDTKQGHDSAEDARAALMLVLRKITMEMGGIWRNPCKSTYEMDPALLGNIFPGGPEWRAAPKRENDTSAFEHQVQHTPGGAPCPKHSSSHHHQSPSHHSGHPRTPPSSVHHQRSTTPYASPTHRSHHYGPAAPPMSPLRVGDPAMPSP